jgi:hypothetical protein
VSILHFQSNWDISMASPKITFGMIVLNGEPFIKYNLQALYPYAHQIIVVEGACPAAAVTANPHGHSIDNTLTTLMQFKNESDPENKVEIVTAEDEGYPDGFWPGEKHEMSQAYAKRTTGNYLWQIDVDEFYQPDEINRIIDLLTENPTISAISFPVHTFWGGLNYILDGFAFRYRGDNSFNRLFKWGPGYRYVTHRPPTVVDANGNNLKELNWISASYIARKGIFLYHYDMLLPIQAERKSLYYSRVTWSAYDGEKILNWKDAVYDKLLDPYHPYTVYTHYSWIARFEGIHPEIIHVMIQDIKAGLFPGISLRNTHDIECLLNSRQYTLGIAWRTFYIVCFNLPIFKLKPLLRRSLISVHFWPLIQKFRGKV